MNHPKGSEVLLVTVIRFIRMHRVIPGIGERAIRGRRKEKKSEDVLHPKGRREIRKQGTQ